MFGSITGSNSCSPETILRWLGGLLAYVALGLMMHGIWRGTRQQAGRTIGFNGGWLRSGWFYLLASGIFFYISSLGWKPLPWTISGSYRGWLIAIGSVFYFAGMAFVLWGRLALGKYYFVSTGFGVQLFEGHQLVTRGPYAIVRHPMYSGLILAAFGSVWLFFTWTTLIYAIFAPLILLRAHREELALAAEFGDTWQAYCTRTPAFVPRLRRNTGTGQG